MTPRDRDIYHFIEMVGVCTAQQVRDTFLPTVDITKTYQRLRVLINNKHIKKFKIGLNNYYYVGKKTSKKILEHDLKTTELVAYLKSNGATIVKFKRNKVIGRSLIDNIYADGYIVYKVKIGDKTYKRHILVEVQRSIQYRVNPDFGKLYGCVEKYNHDSVRDSLKEINASNGFKQFPPLVVITDIEDNTTQLLTTKIIKLPYIKNEEWEVLIR